MCSRMNEIIKKEMRSEKSFHFAWRIFLDCFYRADSSSKVEMVGDKVNCGLDEKDSAFIAAAIHKLCREHSLEVPEWVFDPAFFLKDPYFSNNPPDVLKLIYLVESPPEFKMRNIFTSENTLSRA